MSITEIAVKRPTIVVVIFTVLLLVGGMCYTMLNYDLLPKMDIPTISVTTVYSGAAAGEVESSVTKKLEDALSSLEKIKSMRSTSQEGLSSIIIELESDADADLALQNAQRKINTILSQLPTGSKAPSLNKFSMDDMPIIKLGVMAELPPTRLYQIAKDQIKARLGKIDGVGQVSLVGGSQREIKINVNKSKLDIYKISISQIFSAVSNANLELPTGKIESDSRQYTVRLSGKVKSLETLRNVVVSKNSSASTVKLGDVAEIVDGIAEPTTLNLINGTTSIGIVIQKQTDANTVKVSKLVRKEIAAMEKTYASSKMKFDIATDGSIYTLASANAVMEDLGIAILLVAIVMFLFLHSIRNSFIVMVSIPSSIISVFIAMYIFDFSLNLMTLMALSLVIGILVDDSIVVLENIYRHLEMGKDRKQAALDGRSEIGFTAVAITLVDVVVFLPISMVSGLIGNILREFSLVIVFSTLMSLFVSFTVTPLLASRFSKIEHLTKNTIFGRLALGFESFFNGLVQTYETILKWGLHHRKVVYLIVFVLFISSFMLIKNGFIGSEFISSGDKGEFVVKLEGEPQNTVYQTNKLTQQVEQILLKKPEVVKVFSNVGYSSSSMGTGSGESNKSEMTVTLVSKKQRKISVDDYANQVKEELSRIPGLKVTSSPTTISGGTQEASIQVLLRGADMDKIYSVADSVMGVMKTIQGMTDIKLSVEKSKPEMQVSLNREKMALLGLSVYEVASTIRLAFAGNTDLQYSEGGDDYDINVKFDQFNRKKVEDVGSLTFLNSQGKVIELKEFADIYQSLSPNKLERYDRISSLIVNASVFGRPVGTAGAELKEAITKKIKTEEVSIDYKGQMERQSEAFGSLGTAMLAAIIFVYLIMVALYNSYIYPFVVLFSIPMAIIGALLALALTRQNLSIFSMIGLIMLIGLVAKNAILLVDFANQMREKGHTVFDALVEAGKERLRPIFMTTLAMVIGMLPIALASGEASELKNGLAWVIIGGLTSSLLLTLVLVPSVYMTMDKLISKFSHKKANPEIVVETI